jgi:hypothetical protein
MKLKMKSVHCAVLHYLLYYLRARGIWLRQPEVKQLIQAVTYIGTMNNNSGQPIYVKGISHL